jgi:dihydrofolate synthase/folylpolyglutamate synthase
MEKSCCTDIYQKSIDVLTSQGKFYINLGLERVQAVLEILGNPEKKLKFIHVAGTNGKGSVCAMLSAILKENGLEVGLFTSPHVFEYTERIKINDTEISKENFAQNVLEIIEIAEKNNIHLTEFEILTVVALLYFAKNNVDIVILETGLGGRLDATNIIENNICSVITHIDFDHTERLGDTIEKIVTEKAGIIKQNCPIVTSRNNAGFEVIKKVAKRKNADIFLVEEPLCHCEEGQSPDAAIQKEPYSPIHLFTYSPLKGTYQRENLALVLKVIELLNQNGFDVTEENIEEGLKNVKHPCRFEFLEEENTIIDGAHNPNGTKALRESLDYYFPNQKVRFIFGCLRNKQYSQMMENLFTPNDEIYFYEFSNPNACTYVELAAACKFPSKDFTEFKIDSNTLTVICGSFYMIKELLAKIDKK